MRGRPQAVQNLQHQGGFSVMVRYCTCESQTFANILQQWIVFALKGALGHQVCSC